jgi:predicted DNA-binding protein
MPKLDVIYAENLGDVRLPGRLKDLLDQYCKELHRTKSDIVRSSLCHFLGADMTTIIEHTKLTLQEQDNGGK